MIRRLLLGLISLVGAVAVAYATCGPFTPHGVTHHNLLSVGEKTSPTADPRDRALLEFTSADGKLYIVTYKDTTASLILVDASNCATVTTTTTSSTSTTTSSTTTSTTTSSTTSST